MRAVSFKAVRLHFRLRLIVPPGPLIVLCVSRAAERPIGRATMHTARPRPRIIDGRPWLRRGMLMLAPWLLLPPCVSGSEFRRNPRRVLETFACLACYAIVIGLVASLAPLLLLPIGLAAACVTLIALNYTRPSYSMRRGAPAGGLPLLDAVPSTDDPDFFVKRAARHGPVFKALSAKMPTVCVVGLPLALKVLRENEAKLHPTPTTFAPLIPRDLVRSMEPADHRHYRRILQDAIRDEAVYACQPEIDAIVASGLSALADASAARGNDGIHARAHLESLVTLSMLRLFVGLTPGSADAEDAAAHLAVIGEEVRGRRGSRRFRAAELAAKQIVSIIRRQESAVLRAVASGREPPPSFLATLLREYPNALDDPTISANFAFLLRTTTTDLTGLLHWIVKMLGDNNDCLVALRRSPDQSGMAERVVMETLRLQQSEYIARDVRKDIAIGEFVVPAGWKLRVCVHESHRDPAVFADPDRFDPDRFKARFNRHQYSPLGAHGHACLGVETTRVLASAFVQQLARGYELVVASDGPLDWRFHWRPGSRHRIILRPLSAQAFV